MAGFNTAALPAESTATDALTFGFGLLLGLLFFLSSSPSLGSLFLGDGGGVLCLGADFGAGTPLGKPVTCKNTHLSPLAHEFDPKCLHGGVCQNIHLSQILQSPRPTIQFLHGSRSGFPEGDFPRGPFPLPPRGAALRGEFGLPPRGEFLGGVPFLGGFGLGEILVPLGV